MFEEVTFLKKQNILYGCFENVNVSEPENLIKLAQGLKNKWREVIRWF